MSGQKQYRADGGLLAGGVRSFVVSKPIHRWYRANGVFGLAGTNDAINRPHAGSPSRCQRFPVSKRLPQQRLPGGLVQPEGKFHAGILCRNVQPIRCSGLAWPRWKLRFLPVEPARGVGLYRVRSLTSKRSLMSGKPTWGVERSSTALPQAINRGAGRGLDGGWL